MALSAQDSALAALALIRGSDLVDDVLKDTESVPAVLSALFDVLPNLSSGEKVVVNFAGALWNGAREARVADLFAVDRRLQLALVEILKQRLES